MAQNKITIAEVEQKWSESGRQSWNSSRAAYWIVALAVGVACLLYQRTPGHLGYPLDDSYISLHSAQVLHWGSDPNFPGTAPLVGITNAPYVLLLWVLLLILPPLVAMQAASWLGVLCYALGLVALGRAFRLPLLTILALAGLGLTIAKVPYHLLNGVETGMAMGVTLWILALVKANTIRSRTVAALLCGVAPFLRPELVALCGLVLVAVFLRHCEEQGSVWQATRQSAQFAGIAVAAALPWLIWYGVSTGSVIPQTIAAKRLFFADGCAPGTYRWEVMQTSVRLFLAVLGVFIASVIFLARSTLGRCAAMFLPLFFLAYYEELPSALMHNQGRYTYILVPMLLLGLASGLSDRWLWAKRAAYLVLLCSCLQTAGRFSFHWHEFLQHRDGATQSLNAVATWSKANLPPTATLLIHDAGYISYATRFQLVDFVGLKTLSSIAMNRRYNYGRCGAGPALAVSEIARQARPDYLVVTDDWDRAFGITTGLHTLGWGVDEINHSGSYRVFQLSPP
ncbi:MAG: hypothetical protein WAM89_19615 [Terriglobales bacterium]